MYGTKQLRPRPRTHTNLAFFSSSTYRTEQILLRAARGRARVYTHMPCCTALPEDWDISHLYNGLIPKAQDRARRDGRTRSAMRHAVAYA
jgi:hypothetical protein